MGIERRSGTSFRTKTSRMHLVRPIILLLAISATASAQHVPDPAGMGTSALSIEVPAAWQGHSARDGDGVADPWTYYPLAVGNVWEYQSTSEYSMRIEIPRDTIVNDNLYFKWDRYVISPSGSVISSLRFIARYDSTISSIVIWNHVYNEDQPAPFALCPLDAKELYKELDCSGEWGELIGIGDDGSITFSDTTLTDMNHKSYDTIHGWFTYFSGLGPVQEVMKDGFGYKWLTYFRDQENEYGDENFPVESEPNASGSRLLTLDVYPNPTAGSFTAAFSLLEAAHVRIEVFDVLGRRVATLSNGRYAAGEHGIQLQTGHLPAGLYLVRIELTPEAGGSHVFTRRVTVVR